MARKVRKKKRLRAKVILGAMGASIGLLGVGYAGWTGGLNVTQKITTGEMDFVFREKSNGKDYFEVSVAEIDKHGRIKKGKKLKDVTISYDNENKQLNFIANDPVDIIKWGKKDKLICIDYEIAPSQESSVLQVAPVQGEDDRGVKLKEPVVFEPGSASVWIGNCEIPLPPILNHLVKPLSFDAFNKMEVVREAEEVTMKGTVLLQLQEGKQGDMVQTYEKEGNELEIYDVHYEDLPEEIRLDLLEAILMEHDLPDYQVAQSKLMEAVALQEADAPLCISDIPILISGTYNFVIPLAFDQFNAEYDYTSPPDNKLTKTTEDIKNLEAMTEEGE